MFDFKRRHSLKPSPYSATFYANRSGNPSNGKFNEIYNL